MSAGRWRTRRRGRARAQPTTRARRCRARSETAGHGVGISAGLCSCLSDCEFCVGDLPGRGGPATPHISSSSLVQVRKVQVKKIEIWLHTLTPYTYIHLYRVAHPRSHTLTHRSKYKNRRVSRTPPQTAPRLGAGGTATGPTAPAPRPPRAAHRTGGHRNTAVGASKSPAILATPIKPYCIYVISARAVGSASRSCKSYLELERIP